jgi:general secretion pathway protein J
MITPARCDGEAGFSLVEVIVALAMLAMIVAMVPGTLRLGARAWETTARLDEESQVLAARTFLTQRLAESVPLYVEHADGRLGLAFRGEADALEFVAPSAGGPAGGGLYRYRLEAVEVAGAARERGLLLRQVPFRPGEIAADLRKAGGDERLLVGHARNVAFRYFGAVPGEPRPRWHTTWLWSDRHPLLVDITMQGAPGVAGQPLVVEPRLQSAP